MSTREDSVSEVAGPNTTDSVGTVSARRATSDVAVQIIAQVGNLALGLVVTALIARRLHPVGFGEWSTIFAVVVLAGYFADFKLQTITIREIAAAPEREGDWLGALLSLRALLGVPVAVVSAAVLVVIARTPAMRLAGIILSLTIATGALSYVAIVFQLRVRNDLTMAALTVNSLAWGAAAIAITASGGGMVPLAVAFIACSVLTGTIQIWMATRRAKIKLRGASGRWPLLVRTGAGVGLAGLLTLAYGRIDQVLVYALAPQRADAGLYGGLYRILDSASFVPVAVMTTLFPMMAAAVTRDLDRARALVQTALDYLAMVSLPVLAFSIVASRPLLRFLLGSEFTPAAGSLPVLMAAYAAICWGYVAGNMVIVLGIQAKFIRYAIIALVINVALNVALVPSYGYHAAAWVTLITELVVQVLSLRAVLSEIQMRLALARVAQVAAAAALLGGALYGLGLAGAGLVVLIITSLLLYPLLLLGFRALDIAELRSLVRERKA